MQRNTIIFLFVGIIAAISAYTTEESNKIIWNKYRHELISAFSRDYCGLNGQGYPCSHVDKTVFQFVDEPRDALWHENRFYINEDVCLYVPAYKTSYSPKCLGYDCTFPQVYSQFIRAIPSAGESGAAFLKYSRAPKESFTEPREVAKSFPWKNGAGLTLDRFVASASQQQNDNFRLAIDRNTPIEFVRNKWGLGTPLFDDGKNFIRTIAKADGTPATLSDYAAMEDSITEEQDAQIEDRIASDSTFLFRRRRSSAPPPPVVQKPVIIQTNTFQMNFYAKEVKAVRVQPGEWFDRELVRRLGPQMAGWFGADGKMPLLPETVYVAYKPRVELVVSESQLNQLKNDLENKAVLYWLVGGANFKQSAAVPMQDGEEADQIYWEEIDVNATVPTDAQNLKNLLANNEEVQVNEEKIEDYAAGDASFLFRRRRRSAPPPPPPPPPPPQVERNFKVVFQSNSNTPQILGVVSEILP